MKVAILYPPVESKVLGRAMAGVGPRAEWAWYDYLAPGDSLRVVRLREVAAAPDTPEDVKEAAMAAHAEIRRVAIERMVAAGTPWRDSSHGSVVPEDDPQALRAAISRAYEEVRSMRSMFTNQESDYCAGANEACDRIAAALVATG